MGLPNLKTKIKHKVNQNRFSEEDVLYTIAEIRKYIERSHKELGDPDELKVDEKKFETIKFFRNWMLHPEKHSQDLDTFLKSLTTEVRDGIGNDLIETILLEKLMTEILEFCTDVKIDTETVRDIGKTNFFEKLKFILHEQPIQRLNGTSIGYDDNFKFTTL